jgi:hypothetical protein
VSKTYDRKTKSKRGEPRREARKAKIERTHASLRIERMDDQPKERQP